jgi:hypothetical protein
MRITHLLAGMSAPALVLAMLTPSYADDVSNDLDASIDTAAEVMTLGVGGPPSTTHLFVQPRNSDGKSGCNLTSSASLTVSISSSDPSVASVSPATATFTSCGDQPQLTVTPAGAGTTHVTVTQTANTTDGTFNLAPASFDVTVSGATNTAPSVTVGGVTDGASYAKGSVPAATCDVTDAEDGPSSTPATLSSISGPYAEDGIGSQTASCSATDAGGLTAQASATYSIIDPSAPGISYTLSPTDPDGDNGWYRGDVLVDWTVTEDESPHSLQTSGCDDFSISSDQVGTTYTCSASSAGGPSEVTTSSIKRDGTAPTLALAGGPEDGAGYYWGFVPSAPICTADDALSGVTAAGCSVTGYGDTIGHHDLSASASDNAGNTASTSRGYDVQAWTLKGFYAPVDMGGAYNVVKGGSTVPLKFEIFAGDELTTTAAVKSFTTTRITCNGAAVQDPVEILSTGGTSLRYDTTAGQFIQNWKTPTGAGTCYSATMTAADGSSVTAFFKLK